MKSHEEGGLNFGTMGSSAILATILIALVLYTTLQMKNKVQKIDFA